MNLGFVFTRGVDLKLWFDKGLLFREKRIFEEQLASGSVSRVTWFTYGSDDEAIAKDLYQRGHLDKRIVVRAKPRFLRGRLGDIVYSLGLTFLQYKAVKSCDVIRTNQMDGVWAALLMKVFLRKPVLVRTGYTWSKLTVKISKHNSWFRVWRIKLIERIAYKVGDLGLVTSMHDLDYLIRELAVDRKKLVHVANYVDVDKFRSIRNWANRCDDTVLFVGRFSQEKNIKNLMIACKQIGVKLDLVGSGDQQEELEVFARELQLEANFKGKIPNDQLPEVYSAYQIYCLPSVFDAMPKTLLEAMACGCLCVGTRTSGIEELLKGGRGLLSEGVSAEDLAATLKLAISKGEASELRELAAKEVKENRSLKSVVRKESEIIRRVCLHA